MGEASGKAVISTGLAVWVSPGTIGAPLHTDPEIELHEQVVRADLYAGAVLHLGVVVGWALEHAEVVDWVGEGVGVVGAGCLALAG